jgi:hypothetical protein
MSDSTGSAGATASSSSATAILTEMWARERADEAARRETAIAHAFANARPLGLRGLPFVMGTPGVPMTVGDWGHVRVPFACEIQSVCLTAGVPGTITVDIRKTPAGEPGAQPTPASADPAAATSICAGNPPALAGTNAALYWPLTDWLVTLRGGELLVFYVTAATVNGQVSCNLELRAT